MAQNQSAKLQKLDFDVSGSKNLVIIGNLVLPEGSLVRQGLVDHVKYCAPETAMQHLKQLLGIRRKKHIVDSDDDVAEAPMIQDKKSVSSESTDDEDSEDFESTQDDSEESSE